MGGYAEISDFWTWNEPCKTYCWMGGAVLWSLRIFVDWRRGGRGRGASGVPRYFEHYYQLFSSPVSKRIP